MANLDESAFSFEELFFSKTDKKGIIQSGNSVFKRVSEYSWEELFKKPHNVIRHPDMPRGVFHLLWDYLKADKPLGAFVKNRSKTGKHYWVFALAMPVQDGYLSVRIKPGGDLLKIIETEYSVLRTKELKEKILPEDSHKLLLQRLKELGFLDYDTFMNYALFNQIENRCQETKVPLTAAMSLTNEIRSVFMTVMAKTTEILQAYRKTRYIPMNLEIKSAAIGPDGVQLSVVANQYQKLVSEINSEINIFEQKSQEIVKKVEMGQFYICASQLMMDVTQFIQSEKYQNENQSDTQDLIFLSQFYMKKSREGAKEIVDVLTEFSRICESLQMMATGLELVRLTGKIEIARLPNASGAGDLIRELRTFQVELSQGLRLILELQKTKGMAAAHLLKSSLQ